MAVIHKTRVKEVASNKPSDVQTFTLPDTAATGFRTFSSAYNASEQLPYHATNGVDWESGIGTFTTGTPNTIVRSTILESSNADAEVDFSAGADVEVFVEWPAVIGSDANLADSVLRPGGRLTLESGVAVTTTDQLAKTTLYYTPSASDVIQLWNGGYWKPYNFSEFSVALGTVVALRPYDVFCYLNAGVPALELVAWTDDTTRASAVSVIDGRYCKTSDKARLLLGTVLPTTTTEIEDSLLHRGVSNLYNKEYRLLKKATGDAQSTYTATGVRAWGNNPNTYKVRFVCVLANTGDVAMNISNFKSSSTGVGVGLLMGHNQYTSNVNSNPANSCQILTYRNSYDFSHAISLKFVFNLGVNTLYLCQRNVSSGDITSNWTNMFAGVEA